MINITKLKKKDKASKGITLIALVITIIVLLILVAVTIVTLTGENGILSKSGKAKEETKRAEYLERLKVIGIELQSDRKLNNWNNQEYMNNYEQAIKKDKIFEKAKEIKQLEGTEKITIQVITEEGWEYWVTEDNVEYIGESDEIKAPDLQESDIDVTISPREWTNGAVIIEIKSKIQGYTLEYSTDRNEWNQYVTAITMEENGEIYVRLNNASGQAGDYTTIYINNIDKINPTASIVVEDTDNNNVKITVTASDEGSGLEGTYQYYLGDTFLVASDKNSYTYTGLSIGIEYTLKVVVADKVGNYVEKSEKVIPMPYTADTEPYLPEGAEVLDSTNLDTGLIIKDSNENEWVWIEVPKSIYTNTAYNGGTAPTSSKDYAKIESVMQAYANDYRIRSDFKDTFYSTAQHGFANATEYKKHKNSMLKSVYENGGFYIGRYETGTKTARTSGLESLTTPIIQRDAYPYNIVTCSEAQTLAKQLATGGKTSSLMFGIQWDLIMKYIEEKEVKTQDELKTNSRTWGNYYAPTFNVNRGKYKAYSTWENVNNYTKPASIGVLFTTGASERNSVLGIYDLAGNVWEWTLEKSSNNSKPCVIRGGSYSNVNANIPASGCTSETTANDYDYIGFRPALW